MNNRLLYFIALICAFSSSCTPKYLSLHVINEKPEILTLRSEILPAYFMDRDTFKFNMDSILNANVENILTITQLCYPIRFDSLFDNTVDRLLNDLSQEPNHKRQVRIANKIVKYGHNALTSIQLFKDQNNPKMAFWLEALRISLWGTTTIYYVQNEYDYSFNPFRKPLNEINYSSILSRAGDSYNQWLHEPEKDIRTMECMRDFVVQSLRTGKPSRSFRTILGSMILTTVSAKNDDLISPYKEFINKRNMELTKWFLYYIGAERDDTFYPDLLLQALQNPNEEIVDIALSWTSPVWDKEKKEAVHHEVNSIFNGSNERLKFKAAYILLEDFDEKKAFDYFLTQAKSGEVSVRITATRNIRNPCEWGDEMSDEVYEVLFANLMDSNEGIRLAAIDAFLGFNDDRVIKSIVPFLNHDNKNLRRDIVKEIAGYKNRDFVIEQLKEQIATTSDKDLREATEDLLNKF